jgi:hypothetical protein
MKPFLIIVKHSGRNEDQKKFFSFFILSGDEIESLGTAANIGLLYESQMIGDGDCLEIGGMKIGRGNRSTRRKPVLAPRSSITKAHLTRPNLNPGCRGGKAATDRLSYGAA